MVFVVRGARVEGLEQRVRGWFGRHGLALFASLLVALVGLETDRRDIALVSTLDKHLGDRRIAFASPIAKDQRSDIAVVLIAEETLLDYESRSPIDRTLLAEVVRAIDAAGPRAIGLDIIFDRPTSADSGLIAALKSTTAPLVLGAIDTRAAGASDQAALRVGLERQAAFLAAVGCPYGHLMLERKQGHLAHADAVVRYVAPPLPMPRAPESFADTLAAAAGYQRESASNVIAWQRAPATHALYATMTIPRHVPSSVKPGLAGLTPPGWSEILKGRIVLLGATMLDRDLHRTPLSVVEELQVPGVLIHAQIVAQRVDGNRDVRIWPWWLTLLVVTGLAFACLRMALNLRLDPQNAAFAIGGLLLIGLLSLVALIWFRVSIPSIALATAWFGGGFCGTIGGWYYRHFGHNSVPQEE